VSAGETFFSKLKTNGLVVNPTNGLRFAALSSGQIDIAFGTELCRGRRDLYRLQHQGEVLDPVTILPSAIGIDAKAPKQEQLEAEEFASFVLSTAGQKVMQTGDPPVTRCTTPC